MARLAVQLLEVAAGDSALDALAEELDSDELDTGWQRRHDPG